MQIGRSDDLLGRLRSGAFRPIPGASICITCSASRGRVVRRRRNRPAFVVCSTAGSDHRRSGRRLCGGRRASGNQAADGQFVLVPADAIGHILGPTDRRQLFAGGRDRRRAGCALARRPAGDDVATGCQWQAAAGRQRPGRPLAWTTPVRCPPGRMRGAARLARWQHHRCGRGGRRAIRCRWQWCWRGVVVMVVPTVCTRPAPAICFVLSSAALQGMAATSCSAQSKLRSHAWTEDRPVNELPRSFKIATVWLLLGLRMFLGVQWWQNQQARTRFRPTAPAIEIRRGADGHYHWPGTINGRQVDFLIDTGATGTAISAALAAELGSCQPRHRALEYRRRRGHRHRRRRRSCSCKAASGCSVCAWSLCPGSASDRCSAWTYSAA